MCHIFRIYGPNSEIEWNKEGSRRYLIIDRKLPQTALSIVANNASYVGKKLNECLLSPAHTTCAQQTSHNSQNTNGAAKLVTEDPNDVIIYDYLLFCLFFFLEIICV